MQNIILSIPDYTAGRVRSTHNTAAASAAAAALVDPQHGSNSGCSCPGLATTAASAKQRRRRRSGGSQSCGLVFLSPAQSRVPGRVQGWAHPQRGPRHARQRRRQLLLLRIGDSDKRLGLETRISDSH